MKIQEGVYYCEWCGKEFNKELERVEGNGRKGVGVAQCICPKCNRKVSQKTKIERKSKLERGEKI